MNESYVNSWSVVAIMNHYYAVVQCGVQGIRASNGKVGRGNSGHGIVRGNSGHFNVATGKKHPFYSCF